jgi:hypothetical protein
MPARSQKRVPWRAGTLLSVLPAFAVKDDVRFSLMERQFFEHEASRR